MFLANSQAMLILLVHKVLCSRRRFEDLEQPKPDGYPTPEVCASPNFSPALLEAWADLGPALMQNIIS